MGRYNKDKILICDSEYYKPLRDKRNTKFIRHYATPRLYHPTLSQRVAITSTTHIWKYGDRFYNLADKYYGDPRYWWVIAWYNHVPTEVNLSNGSTIQIPLNIETVLRALGV
jgi:nucleoid-associated protein YgaU